MLVYAAGSAPWAAMSVLQTDPLFSPAAMVSRKRLLDSEGRVLVREGQQVEADTVVARSEEPEALRVLDVAASLGVSPTRVEACLRVRPGERIAVGDVVAETRRWGLWRRRVMTPVGGRVQSVRDGLVLLRMPLPEQDLVAGMPGVVQCVHDGRGVTIATAAAHLRGCWGSGGYGIGPLTLVADSADGWLHPDQVGLRQRGAILVASRLGDAEVIQRAVTCLVQGLVVGSMPRQLARQCEQASFPVLVTEGFGEAAMSEAVFEGLRGFQQKGAVLFGAEARHGLSAELIIPRTRVPRMALVPHREMSVGAMVRLTAGPRRGAIGIISEVPERPERTALGDWVNGVFVRLGHGERVFAALSNVQVLVRDT